MKAAVFVDRDGVINPLVWNAGLRIHDSPYRPEEVSLMPGAAESISALRRSGYLVFIVSNQPGVAKGKCRQEDLLAVHREIEGALAAAGTSVDHAFYCYHHPDAIIDELREICGCRKPADGLLKKAQTAYGIDLRSSWMIGDRDSDVACGRSAGTRTILIEYTHSSGYRQGTPADYVAGDLASAERIISRRGTPLAAPR